MDGTIKDLHNLLYFSVYFLDAWRRARMKAINTLITLFIMFDGNFRGDICICLGDDHGHVLLGQGRDGDDGGDWGEEDMGEGRAQGEQETQQD